MAIKTNKSFAKRFKVTRTGKILSRKPGQNHFNAKERSRTSMNKKRMATVTMDNKAKSRFLVNL
ncbi:MAG: Ribosomal protein [Candidatus Parcubacteria bacterium]|nr:Ribosomal protein [Candidatus Parcubacteria bacterium]